MDPPALRAVRCRKILLDIYGSKGMSMCGVFGFVSTEKIPGAQLIEGLRSLEYRGYDSWGVAVVENGNIILKKDVGTVPSSTVSLPHVSLGFGHTRWATHGGVTQENAHPHVNEDATVAVVHNGIIENFQELKDELKIRHTFLSETDSEVLVHLYEDLRHQYSSAEEAFRAVFRLVSGLNAIVLLDVAEGCLFVAKNGSPLVLGLDEDRTYIASDALSFQPFTSRAVFLEDFQGAQIDTSGVRLFSLQDGSSLPLYEVKLEAQIESVQHTGFDSFMEKEISEQSDVLQRMANFDINHYADALELLRSARSIYITGCGTAFHAGEIGARWLSSALSKKVWPILASEFESVLPFIDQESLVVVLSQSGETIDVVQPVSEAKAQGAKILSLVNVPYSTLFRLADVGILLSAGPEKAVASTKAFTAKITALWLLSELLHPTDGVELSHHLLACGEAIEAVLLQEKNLGALHTWAEHLQKKPSIFVLGNGELFSVAREIALKVKEISYIHAEGLVASELKHGTLALVGPGVPCLVLSGVVGRDSAIGSSIQEIRARGGDVTVFGGASFGTQHFWETGSSRLESVLTTTVLGQVLALELTRVRGLNPDKPRNLAKSVTVK